MAQDNYISLDIEGETLDIDVRESVPTINYSLESEDNFEEKTSAEAFNINALPTLNNQSLFNTAENPSVIDQTADETYNRPRFAKYIANGIEVLIGKFFLQSVKIKNGQVAGYKGKMYGLNGDWVIDLKEKSLYDFVNPNSHTFDVNTVIGSWDFNGQNEQLDYVYAPVRYRKPFGAIPDEGSPADDNVLVTDLKPAISIYWLLYRGFKSVGYKINSTFLSLEFFRRQVMPWTWGGFDYMDDTRWEPLKFLAKAETELRIEGDYTGYPNFNVRDDTPGAYDNSNTYTYTGSTSSLPYSMVWTYPTAPAALNLGKLRAGFSIQLTIDWKVQKNSDAEVKIYWFKNGSQIGEETLLSETAPALSGKQSIEFKESFIETDVFPGDYVACRVYVHTFQSTLGFARINTLIEQFSINYMKLTDGSVVSLYNYPKFKNYKWMDLLRGVVDGFNMQIGTDPVRKEVFLEPTHGYNINGVDYPGYYNRNQIDWSGKRDISKDDELEIFSDYEREFIIKFKDDAEDGGLKKIQDRNQVTIGLGKYVLPERFKTGKKEMVNRFFGATMHYEHDVFRYITGVAPQLIAMIPENVSNTSGSESENTFQPKIVFYKGNITGVGGWKFNGSVYNTLPFMFSVNYKAGGESDPVLSYSDQKIGSVVARGLLKKFFWQRMAIYRHGRKYNPIHIKLNNYDVSNFLHRESIIINSIEYIITQIKDYDPITQDSTACTIWMFMPVSLKDEVNTYPSNQSIQSGSSTINSFDVKYWQHLLLNSDIPK